jgi:hypothetical protein
MRIDVAEGPTLNWNIYIYLSVDKVQGNDERAPCYQNKIYGCKNYVCHKENKVSMVVMTDAIVNPWACKGKNMRLKKICSEKCWTASGSHAHLQWWSNLRTQELQILQWWARSGFGRWPFGNMTVICLNTFYPCIVSNATIVPTFFTCLWVDWIFLQLQQHFSYRRLCINLLQVSIKKFELCST